MDKKVDVRVLTLKKHTLPYVKTKETNLDDNSDEMYISAHYFDFIEISKVHLDCQESNFMEEAYKKINTIRINNQKDNEFRIKQSIILFKYFNENDSQNLDDFWNINASHIFITLLKVYNCSFGEKLGNATKAISELLIKAGISEDNFQIYYTFDYSDLVIMVKNTKNDIFQDLLWKINFSLEKNKLIKDSITFYGINFDCFQKLAHTNDIDKLLSQDDRLSLLSEIRLNASISLGVQDPILLKPILDLLNSPDFKNNHSINAPFGRHDITIVLDNISVISLIRLYGFIEKTSNDSDNNAQPFLNLKVISSVTLSESIEEIINDNGTNSKYKNNDNNIFIDKIAKVVEQYTEMLSDGYFMEITEINRSMHELSRNCFSEEFLISIYYSFYVFLKICINKVLSNPEDVRNFQRIFFSYINILSHCTMHGEKCFIQAAPFNSLLVDIPPKILAFYTSVTYKIKKILSDNENQLFSFMFIPDFNPNIKVNPISCGSDIDDRLIAIYLNEKTLYNPYKVVCVMVHEIAHFVGNDARCRDERLNNVIVTIIKLYMYTCGTQNGVIKLADKFSEIIINDIKNTMSERNYKECYSSIIEDYLKESNFLIDIYQNMECEMFSEVGENIELNEYLDTDDVFYDYIDLLMSNKKNKRYSYKVLTDLLMDKIRNKSLNDFYNDYIEQCCSILGAYKESYSDMVLCILTSICKEEYIRLINEEVEKADISLDKLSSCYLFNKIKEGDINLELGLRINAIFIVVYDDKINDNVIDEIEYKIYNTMVEHLVKYLNECKKMILCKIKSNTDIDSFSKLLKGLKTMSSEDTFYSIFEEIFKYKENMTNDIIL